MVKQLSHTIETSIREAIDAVQKRTSAKIGVVVLESSTHYQDFILLYGLLLGTAISIACWLFAFKFFLWLLAVQLGITLIVDGTPPLRRLCIRLVPQRIRHHRAATTAHLEYLALHAELPKDQPFVFLFISLSERYIHVFTNPVVHQQIPKNWDVVTNGFIALIRKGEIHNACKNTVEYIAEIIEKDFPTQSG